MAKAPPSFQFYPSDFISGTMHLDHQAIACYLLLLCFQWQHKILPNDVQKLRRICRWEGDFGPIWEEIRDKFVELDDGSLVNERLETTRNRALELSRKRSDAGKKGGQAIAKQLPKQKGKQNVSKGSMKYEDRSMKSNTRRMDNFEQFWTSVKTKTGKARAAKHYATAIELLAPDHEDPHGYLIDRLEAYQASDRFRGEYAWEPCTWLRDGHYDDDPATWQDRQSVSMGANGKKVSGYMSKTEERRAITDNAIRETLNRKAEKEQKQCQIPNKQLPF